MDPQLLLVVLIVTTASSYLTYSVWSSWRAQSGKCGGGCARGCTGTKNRSADGKPTIERIPLQHLQLRRRDGSAPP